MRNRSILSVPILILALIVRPVFGGDNLSRENAQELVQALSEANEFWLKADATLGIPKYEYLLPQVEKAFGKDSPQVGIIVFRIGFLYSVRGDYEKAVSNLEKSLKLISKLPDNSDNLETKANLYWGLGMSYKSLLRLNQAIQAFNESLRFKERLVGSDDPSLMGILFAVADLDSEQRRFLDAIPLLERTVAISEKNFGTESAEAATALSSLGFTSAQAGKFEPALACLKRSLQIREKILPPTSPTVVTSVFILGSIYSQVGDYGQAMPLLERSVALSEKNYVQGDAASAFQFARALNNLGSAQVFIGDYDTAIATLQRSLNVMEAAFGGASINLVAPLNYSAMAYCRRGDFERAQEFYERALRILQAAPTDENTEHVGEHVDTLNYFAQMLLDEGQEDAAFKLFSQACELGESRLGATELPVAYSLNGLALINQRRGKVADALVLFQRSLAILENKLGPSNLNLAGVLTNIAALLRRTGDMNRAQSTLQKALAIEEKALPPGHPNIARTLGQLAVMLPYQQRDEAERLLRKSIAILDTAVGQDNPDSWAQLANLGQIEIVKGDFSKGLDEFVEATRRQRRYLAGQTPLQQDSNASRIHDEVQSIRNLFHSVLALSALSDSRLASLSGAEQLAFGKALLEEIETVRAKLTADGRVQVQSLREQADSVRRRLVAIPKQEGTAWGQQRMDWQNSERDKLERELKTIQEKLASASDLVSRTITESKLSLNEIARRLPPSAVLVDFVQYRRADFTVPGEYQWKEQRYAAYLTFPLVGDSASVVVERVDLGDAVPIDEAIGVITKRFATGQYGAKDVAPALQRLSELVYVPLAKHLLNTEHLIVCPDGQLDRVPFEMLPVGNKFLLEEKTISYVTSAREIVRVTKTQSNQEPQPKKRKSFVLGNPDFDLDLAKANPSPSTGQRIAAATPLRSLSRDSHGLKFKPLPNAEAEARSIAKLLGSESELRLGADAREAELKAVQSPRVLHLATHAFFLSDQEFKQMNLVDRNLEFGQLGAEWAGTSSDWENPMVRCGIALAGANRFQQTTHETTEDGLLTGLQAALLNLQGTELVILSACDSGSGEVKIGEGVMSLCRAFRIAGAQTVLASHWAVSDKATSELMTEFMRRWRAGESRANAWHNAQLTLLHSKDFSNPYFWAAFTLTGQW